MEYTQDQMVRLNVARHAVVQHMKPTQAGLDTINALVSVHLEIEREQVATAANSQVQPRRLRARIRTPRRVRR